MREPNRTALCLLASLVPCAASSQEITGVGEELALRSLALVAVVAPDYPKGALQLGETAVVELSARVRADGTIDLPTLRLSGGNEPFDSAIREVARFWTFRPPIDQATCESRAAELRMRVWFEIESGKPKVSVSNPIGEARNANRQDQRVLLWKRHRKPEYPQHAWSRGIEGVVIAVARVDRNGKVVNVHLRPGVQNDTFGFVTARAIRRWEFEPGPEFPGGASHVCVEIPVQYRMATNLQEDLEASRDLPPWPR